MFNLGFKKGASKMAYLEKHSEEFFLSQMSVNGAVSSCGYIWHFKNFIF